MRGTTVKIDMAALQHNVRIIRQLAPQSKIMAMVKANAYGHGITAITQALSNSDAFGVASIEEGIQLREAGIQQPIVLMEGFFDDQELKMIQAYDFTIVIHHEEQLQILEKTTSKKNIPAWLKINTGMHRLGIAPDQLFSFYGRLMACDAIQKPVGFMTHFANADCPQDPKTQEQIHSFKNTVKAYNGPRSLANSAGILAFPEAHADWIRPGIMLYGVSPFENRTGASHHLKPVMTLESQLIAIHFLKKGDAISYGSIWTSPENMRLGIVAVGYGDGYPRNAQQGTPVLINGVECPIVGRISMDMLSVDLRPCHDAKLHDRVILWGKELPVERIAKCCNTISYELLCNISKRVKIISI